MSTDFIVAGREDADRLLVYIRSYYETDGLFYDEASIAPALARLLAEPSLGRAWFIERDGAWVGYLLATFGYDLEFGGALLTLTDLYIEPEHRGQGIGTEALEFAKEFCRSNTIRTLHLQVLEHNAGGLRFYERNGLRRLGRIPMYMAVTPIVPPAEADG